MRTDRTSAGAVNFEIVTLYLSCSGSFHSYVIELLRMRSTVCE